METGTVKILVAGKDAINLRVIKSRLLEFGDDWLIFDANCKDAHAECEKVKYDLIILDCEEASHQTVDAVFELKLTKNFATPILVCFQESSTELIAEVLEAGALDFVLKPYKTIELFARVRTALTLSSTIEKLDNQTHVICENQHKMEEVLSGLIPAEIIDELTRYGTSKPKKYREASVLFVDLVDFTRKSRKLSPKIVIDELSEIFAQFDHIVAKNKCTRIKTMGDGYLAVSGIPTPSDDHAINLIKAAIDMRDYLIQRNRAHPVKWDLKIGINSGEVIGSVLGTKNFLFDVFGDTVNEAARMEKTCEPNQINVSKNTYMLSRHAYRFIERLPNDVKGLGIKKMYYLKSKVDHTGLDQVKPTKNIELGKLIEKLFIN